MDNNNGNGNTILISVIIVVIIALAFYFGFMRGGFGGTTNQGGGVNVELNNPIDGGATGGAEGGITE